MDMVDISTFNNNDLLFDGLELTVVVKSQNQVERRQRMIESKRVGRIGRFTPSPTEIGLLANCALKSGKVIENSTKNFREPRHIRKLSNGNFLLTEVNKVLEVDNAFSVKREYSHPYFGYLHSIDTNGTRALVVSSGYDALIEFDLVTGKETWSWFAWDNGYNPSLDGSWYTTNLAEYKKLTAGGKKAVLIDPQEYGEQGVTTANRTAHPNVAVYDPNSQGSVIVGVGHEGRLLKIKMRTGHSEVIYQGLSPMSHGIFFVDDSLAITETTKGEWLWLNQDYTIGKQFIFNTVGGKVVDAGDNEWIQQIIPIGHNRGVAIDANRGLVFFDLEKKVKAMYLPNENWCIQDIYIH